MIIGFDFFNKGLHGIVFNTAIPTSQLDEATIYSGIYDEIFMSVDTSIGDVDEKPTKWHMKNIMDAKFKNDLEAGSIDADGHVITDIHIYRRKIAANAKWILVGTTDYDLNYNVYSFIDRTVENEAYYEYAIVPIAQKVIGEITTSEVVQAKYSGMFISDLENNYRMDINYLQQNVQYNKNYSVQTPLNGEFPIVTYGNQNYETGKISFLPITEEQIQTSGTVIDTKAERELRDKVVNFLNSGSTKVFRTDSGEIKIIATSEIESDAVADFLQGVREVSFNYTEIGRVEGDTLSRVGLVGQATKSKYTYDENGNVIWDI
ncbi:hypothetical protein JXA27_06890 [Aerococcaceae bacterium zg-B36]|uniref:hypothetical protein n=1 Tax=Aerococcaceae bacterium zg-252 TaxID=2796928 RepID=UPI001BD8213A|nr:hypothetical protein [Aerococcaceae bacterium zg-B36]